MEVFNNSAYGTINIDCNNKITVSASNLEPNDTDGIRLTIVKISKCTNSNELELFGFQNLEYWSLKNLKKRIDIESDNTFFDLKNRMNSKKDFQEILKFLTNKIVQELINLNKGKLK